MSMFIIALLLIMLQFGIWYIIPFVLFFKVYTANVELTCLTKLRSHKK